MIAIQGLRARGTYDPVTERFAITLTAIVDNERGYYVVIPIDDEWDPTTFDGVQKIGIDLDNGVKTLYVLLDDPQRAKELDIIEEVV